MISKSLPYSKNIKNPIPGECVYLCVGENKAWELAKNRVGLGKKALVLSPNICPSSYIYPVFGWEILIIDFGIKSIEFAEILFLFLAEYGAIFIHLISNNKILSGMTWEKVNE